MANDGLQNTPASHSQTEKNDMRRAMRALRASIGDHERMRIDALITDRVVSLDEYRDAGILCPYLSVGYEVDTRMLIERAWKDGKKVAIPRCIPGTREMEWHLIVDFEQLEVSSFGVEEPLPNPETLIEIPVPESFGRAIAIVPGFSFDAEGYRLGYGGGFYDTFLPRFNGVSIGLCRSCQMSADPVPRDAHDKPVDIVITEAL